MGGRPSKEFIEKPQQLLTNGHILHHLQFASQAIFKVGGDGQGHFFLTLNNINVSKQAVKSGEQYNKALVSNILHQFD